MKKSLIALAAMVVAGAASAQTAPSSVTLFGIVDVGVQHVDNEGGNNVTRVSSGAYNTSRFGLRGSEDLGGGVSASFWLEAGIDADSGAGNTTSTDNQTTTGGGGLTFNRRSTVSLSGGFGELRLGRDYTPQFWNLNSFEPFGTNGVGASIVYQTISGLSTTAARASNSIGYFLPANLGGVYGQAQYYFGENAEGTTEDNGSGFGVRVGFAAGPVNVAISGSHTEASAGALGEGNINQYNIGGQVDLGFARLMGSYEQDEVLGADNKGWLIGGLVPVGAGEIRLSYGEYELDGPNDPKSQKAAIGYVHNLSKRTAVYATYAHVENDGGRAASVTSGVGSPVANGSSDGLDIGIRHSF